MGRGHADGGIQSATYTQKVAGQPGIVGERSAPPALRARPGERVFMAGLKEQAADLLWSATASEPNVVGTDEAADRKMTYMLFHVLGWPLGRAVVYAGNGTFEMGEAAVVGHPIPG